MPREARIGKWTSIKINQAKDGSASTPPSRNYTRSTTRLLQMKGSTGSKIKRAHHGTVSRKEARQMARLEKRQRKVQHKRGAVLQESDSTTAVRHLGHDDATPTRKRARPSEKPTIGLLAKASKRVCGGKGVKEASEGRSGEEGQPRRTKEKDPLLEAEEEEIRYLEKKLGLVGSKKAKNEEKLFRDLMKFEGFGEDIRDLLKYTDHISKLVANKSGKEDYKPPAPESGEDESDQDGEEEAPAEYDYDLSEPSDDEDGGCENEEHGDTEDEEERGLESDEEAEEDDDESAREQASSDDGDNESEATDNEAEAAEDGNERFTYRPVTGEDIYGRTVADASGLGSKERAYVPPHLRDGAQGGKADAAADLLLKKSVNGLLNRVSETNVETTVRDLASLYRGHARQAVDQLVGDTTLRLCISSSQVMATLIPTYAAVIAGLHFCGGGHAGAMMVERLCKDYDVKHAQLVTAQEAGQEEEEEALARTVDNIVLFLAYLYALGVVACGLVYDLVRKLLAGRLLSERDAELLLLLLRHSGPQLRADDPSALKDIVLLAQEKVGPSEVSPRLQHMVETLKELKNNKLGGSAQKHQGMGAYHERTNRLKKQVQHLRSNMQNKGPAASTLHLSWADIEESDQRGRWWLVGAPWKQSGSQGPPGDSIRPSESNKEETREPLLQDKIMGLAAKQRMNTDVRRSIFSVIVTSADYEDAFERLMSLNLSDQREREVMRVVVDCAGQEKVYNPFYTYLAGRLCDYDPKHRFTLQLTFWDLFKLLDDSAALPARRASNLAKMLGDLLIKGWLTLGVIKVVDVASLSPLGVAFFRGMLLQLLSESSEKELLEVLKRTCSLRDPVSVRQTLAVMLHRHILTHQDDGGSNKALRKRAKALVKLIDQLGVNDEEREG